MFNFTYKDLRKLFNLNYFEVPKDQLIFFGLRGCLPVSMEDSVHFSDSHELVLSDVNYKFLRCTLGQWKPKENTFALFPGSTVPHEDFIKKSIPFNGNGTNQLMTGLFKKYKKGRHKYQAPSSYEAFRMDFAAPIQRTADDLDYDSNDRIEYTFPYDNIHAAYSMGANGQKFYSAGCQVIMGYPKTKNPNDKHNHHIGPWSVFLGNAYGIEQENFYYALLNGRDAAKVSGSRIDKHVLPRLRYGSNDKSISGKNEEYKLVTIVQRGLKEQGYYLGKIDGDFGPATFKAVCIFQLEYFGPGASDGIVGPNTAIGLGIEWEPRRFI